MRALLIFFLLPFCAAAQDTAYHKFKVGLRVAAERSAIANVSANQAPSYLIGGLFILRIARNSGLETGLYFSSRVSDKATASQAVYRSVMIPLNYRKDFHGFYISAGISGSYLVLVNTIASTSAPLDERRQIAVGFNINGGFEKKLSEEWSAFAEGRYAHTFGNKTIYNPGFINYGLGVGVLRKI